MWFQKKIFVLASGLEVSIELKDSTHLTVLRKHIIYLYSLYSLFQLHCLTNKFMIAFGLVKRGRNLVCADGEPPNTYIKVSLRHCLLKLNIN